MMDNGLDRVVREIPPNPPLQKGGTGSVAHGQTFPPAKLPPLKKGGRGGFAARQHATNTRHGLRPCISLLLLFFITLLSLIPPLAQAAVVNSVQSGTTTIASSSSSRSVTITSVDTSKAFLVFSSTVNDADPQDSQVTGQLTNSTTVTFQRNSNGFSTVDIDWYVVEFTSGVSVQRGSATMSSNTVNQSLSSIDTSKSFPIISYLASGTVYGANDFVRARITSSTNLELSQDATISGTVEWQVVEFTGASVQSGDVSFGTTQSSRTATISSVDTSASWLIYNFKSGDGTSSDIGEKLVRGLITNDTTLTFDRSNTGQAIDLSWFLVEFTDGTSVQDGSANMGTGTTQSNVTISSVDTSKTIAAGGTMMRGGRSGYSGDDNPGVGWATYDLTSSTNLQITRATTGSSSADFPYYVVEFVNDTTAPDAVTLSTGAVTDESIELTWTSPGDDGATGTATTYDIRYATSAINNDTDFNNATQATGEPSPSVAGSSESFTVTGLTGGTTYYFAIKTGDEVPNWSTLSNSPSDTTTTDSTAPSAITNLALSNVTETTVDLSWRAPGDDGGTGTATSYDIRYSTSDITNDTDFNNATQVTGEPTPTAADTTHEMTVTGLTAGTTYYFAIKASDEVPNTASLSNVPSTTTTGSDTTAPAAVIDLSGGSATTTTIDLSWTAPGDDYDMGTATSYDIRYSTSAITDGNWASATQATGEPAPSAAGSAEAFSVTGLSPGTTYYFALKTADEAGNWSALSDNGVATTQNSAATTTYYSNADSGTAVATGITTDTSCTSYSSTRETLMDASYNCSSFTITRGSSTFYNMYAASAYAVDTDVVGGTYYVRASDRDKDGANIAAQLFYVDSDGNKTYMGSEVTSYVCSECTSNETFDLSGQSATVPAGSKLGLRVRFYNGQSNSIRLYLGSSYGTYGGTLEVDETSVNDTTAPNAVSDLATGTTNPSSINLSWTSPGDDGATGTASSYDIRYSTSAISNDTDFNNATQAIGEPGPALAGSSESFTVTGLSENTTYYFAIKTADETPNWSGVSNSPSATTTISDSTAPDAVSDLAAGNPLSESIDLNWTAPGDDGATGTATSYDIRYRTDAAIDDSNWDSAVQVSGEPGPSVAGSAESFTVTGLAGSTTYYFAIKAVDDNGNWSGLSNSPSETTSGDGQDPSDIGDLATGAVSNTTVQLSWTAPGDDGTTGTATTYDVRYSTSTITAGNWDSATQVSNEPTPSVYGTSESMYVTGLSAGTTYYFAIKAADDVANWNNLSNVASTTTTNQDEDPPAQITDVNITATAATTVDLAWTATGDDGATGTATSYDIRYSTSAITEGNWNSATQATGEPAPSAAGSSETFQVTGLSADTTYYFGIKAFDDNSNESPLSNVPSGVTTSDPAPGAVNDLGVSAATDSTVTLGWSASGEDNYSGTATSYDIRYSTSTITEGNWASATQATGEPTPAVAYSSESFQVTGLSSETNYYFAIKVSDAAGSWSDISNIASVTTTAAGSGSNNTYKTRVDSGTTVATGISTNTFCSDTTSSKTTLMDTSYNCSSFRIERGSDPTNFYEMYLNTAYSVATNVVGGNYYVRAEDKDKDGGYIGAQLFYVDSGGTKTYMGSEVTSWVCSECTSNESFDLSGQSADVPAGSKLGLRVRYSSGSSGQMRIYLGSSYGDYGGTLTVTETPLDSTAPAAVSDLATGNATSASVELTWTAPGDDGSSGVATSYDIRYSTSAITEGNWASATTVTGEPTPSAAGSAESFVVTGLSAGTTYYFAIKSDDDASNTSAISNSPSATTSSADATAPAAISDLAISGTPGSDSITLTWTAPGDDNNSGTASSYDIRYATSAISNDTDFSSATQVSGEPAPSSAGSTEFFTVTGLDASTTYYFAIKTSDEVPNTSSLSNSPSDTTDSGGTCDVDPNGTYIEAENFTGTISQGSATFVEESSTGGYNGTGYLRSNGGGTDSSPVHEGKQYVLNWPTTGTYNVWIRGYATSGSDDSVFIGLNGSSAGALTESSYNTWSWTNSIQLGSNTISVGSSGSHTFNVWIRESGHKLDGIYLTQGGETPSGGIPSGATVIDPTNCAPPGDAVAPAAVSDLAASNATQTSIDLSWTAPGDDNNVGTASVYDIRYSTSAITATNWPYATQVSGEPSPGAAGSLETMTISGLTAGTTYYFAIKTKDEVPNTSAISNVDNATTLDPPVGGYTADNVIPQAQVSQASDGSGDVTITWKGRDNQSDGVTLNTFEYSFDGGSTWQAPGNDDASAALSLNWSDDGASWSTAATFGAATAHSFTFTTQHGTLTGLDGVDQSDVQVRFKLNDGSADSDSFVTSESFRVDNEIPTATITASEYDADTDTLTITGTDFTTIATAGTDIKSYVDWTKFKWDINGDNATTADITFVEGDVTSLTITDATTLTLVFTGAKGTAIEGTSGYGSSGGVDTLDVTAGFSRDAFGNASTTDGANNADLLVNDPPVGGYTADNVIPAAQITQATDGSGLITIKWKGRDDQADNVTLKTFEYSVDGGSSWNAPTNGDASTSLSTDWADNGGSGWSTAATFGDASFHSFTFNTKHADTSGLDGVDQSDVQVRFKLNDGKADSASFVTSESVRVDNESPTATITSGSYNAGTNALTLTGTDFTTIATAGTDIKSYVDWTKFVWDINGDDATTTDITFVEADVNSLTITDATTLTLELTSGKASTIEGNSDYSVNGGADTLDVTAGFSIDAFGNVATTDGAADATLTTQDPPIGGYTDDNTLPATQISQATDGSGVITINWKGRDNQSDNVTLSGFEYSVDGGSTWNAPTNGDSSAAFSANWNDNGGGGYSTATTLAASTAHSFTLDTQHADLSGLDGVDQSDVMVRFLLNDGAFDSGALTSEAFRVDNELPTATLTSADYNSATDTLTITGTNFTTIATASTDIKSYVDWSKFVWDINGDDATTADITFVESDITSLTITDATTLTLVFTGAKATAIEGTSDYGSSGGADTLDVTAGFSLDAFGNAATTDAVADGALTVTEPDISVTKISSVISDPINGGSNPKRIPGAVVEYIVAVSNAGNASPDNNSTVVTSNIDTTGTEFYYTGGITFVDGATSSNLTMGTVSYSQTAAPGPYVYDYTPSPDGDGYDANITSVRIETSGTFAYGGSPAAGFNLKYRVRVK